MAIEIIAGMMLLLGLYTRIAALLVVPVMAVAVYAHIVIDAWPNAAAGEPPIVLPLAVMASAAYVLWRGAGAWSLDAASCARSKPERPRSSTSQSLTLANQNIRTRQKGTIVMFAYILHAPNTTSTPQTAEFFRKFTETPGLLQAFDLVSVDDPDDALWLQSGKAGRQPNAI